MTSRFKTVSQLGLPLYMYLLYDIAKRSLRPRTHQGYFSSSVRSRERSRWRRCSGENSRTASLNDSRYDRRGRKILNGRPENDLRAFFFNGCVGVHGICGEAPPLSSPREKWSRNVAGKS